MAQCMTKVHTKEVEWKCSKWLVLSCTLLLHFNFHSLPSSSAQSEAKVRHCLAHTYMRFPPTPLTAPHLWTQPGLINNPQLGPTNLIRARGKSKPITVQRTTEDIHFRLISHSLFLAQPLSITENYWDDVCKTWWACPHKWQQTQTIYRSGNRKQEAPQMKSSTDSMLRSGCTTCLRGADQIWMLLSFFPMLFANNAYAGWSPGKFLMMLEKPQNDLWTKLLKEHTVR